MKTKIICFIILSSCNGTLDCERHILPKNFVGKVTIYFGRKEAKTQVDGDGCWVYFINAKGDCYTSRSLKQGAIYPNNTFKFFEGWYSDANRIFEFYEKAYLQDLERNKTKKYIFYHSSGYSYANNVFEYYVDYGANYKKYLYSP